MREEVCVETEEFGACLKQLLHEKGKDYSVEGMAEALSYGDGSTIYRWIRGEKTPSVPSPYVDLIIEYLKLNARQAERLRAAQVYSLRNRIRRMRKPRIKDSEAVESLFENGWGGTHRPSAPLNRSKARGAQILFDAINLLLEAPPPGNRSDEERTITLTWQSREPIEMSAELQESWGLALRQVMKRGWRIRYLCRLDHDIHRSVRLVQMMRDFVSTGNYFPRYFTTYGVLLPPYDLLVIPRVGAAVFFSSARDSADDGGIVTHDPNHIQLLQGHARLLAANTTSFMTPFYGYESREYAAMMRDAELHRGGRLALKDGLSITTQPEEWYTNSPIKRSPTTLSLETWEMLALTRAERIATFKRYLGVYDFYDICTERAIERLAIRGAYPADDPVNRGQQPPEIRLQHLRNVVSLLEEYPHYHLGLVSDRQVNSTDKKIRIPVEVKFAVTADNSVFLGVPSLESELQRKAVGLRIQEPTLAEGFKTYFHEHCWDKIPDIRRERKDVIRFITDRIKEIEREMEVVSQY